jgi:peptidoglycan hydrolase-like protein with peptidoglycan-binding domain
VYRDLSEVDVWDQSRRRARERRELAVARGPELPKRELSVAALVALTGVPVVGATVANALGSSGGGFDQGVTPTALVQAPAPAQKAEAASPAAHPAPVSSRAAAPVPNATPASEPRQTTTTTPKPVAATPQGGASTPAVSSTAAPKAQTASLKTTTRPAGGVSELQRALGVAADGDFGSATERALTRWQRGHGLHADGVAGADTRAALDLGRGPALKRAHHERRQARHTRRRHRSPARPVQHRAGGGVRALQRALGVPADGVFGPGTEKALRRWQRRHGLAADGVAGPQTRAKLGLGSGPVLKRRHRGRRNHSGGGGGGGNSSALGRVIAAANAIATKPYRYGGGHGSWTDSGYDCSGSVSYALHGGGLLSSPLDSGGFMSYGSPGRGRHITIYANSGHAFMVINGRRFDTSARSQTGSRWSGSMRSTAGYVARHPRGY